MGHESFAARRRCRRPAPARLVLVALTRRRWGLAAGAMVATAAGIGVTAVVTRHAGPNIHHMPLPVYLALKAPFNFSKNVMGLSLWADSLPFLRGMRPRYEWTVPRWLPSGSMRRIGVIGWTVTPLNTLLTLLTSFGVIAVLVIRETWNRRPWRRRHRDRGTRGAKVSEGVERPAEERLEERVEERKPGRLRGKDWPLWFAVALAYGLIAFFLGSLLGAAVPRLMGQGWPAFLVAGPAFVGARADLDLRTGTGLAVAQLVVAWVPQNLVDLAARRGVADWVGLASALCVATATQVFAWRIMTAARRKPQAVQ